MSDLFLAIIAVGVLVIAAVQVAAAVFAARAASRLDRLAIRIEQDIRPVVANLQALTADAARVTSLAAAQVDRADRLFTDLARRVEHTLAAVQSTLLGPAREGLSLLGGLKGILAAFRELRDTPRKRTTAVEEEDALFIG